MQTPRELTPEVAVIIPTLNSPMIDRVISAVLEQEPKAALRELLVVGRDDAGLICPADKLKFIDTGKPVSAGTARNLGINASRAPLILFLDSDCIPEPNWLAGHLEAHAKGHQLVGGGVLPTGKNYWHKVYNLSLFNKTLFTSPEGAREILPTLNLSVQRTVVEQSGLMKEELLRGQDADWIQRMRKNDVEPFFWPNAPVRHEHNRYTLKTLWRDFARSGYFARKIRLDHAEILNTPSLLKNRVLVRLLSPAIAAWSLVEISRRHPGFARMYWKYLPGIYLSKLAWCWGAGKRDLP